MTEAVAAEAEKIEETAEAVEKPNVDPSKESTAEPGKSALGSVEEFEADPNKSDEENAAALAEWEKGQAEKDKTENKGGLPDDWREIAAGGDQDTLKLLRRYGSIAGVAKAFRHAQKVISSGGVKSEMPDPSDEKAMAEWRKSEGIPDDPSGYKLPDDVTKRLTDADKPILSSFTEFAHSKNARPDVVEIASQWYVEMEENAAAQAIEADKANAEAAEDALRKDWSHGEYKSNLTMAKRWIDSVPGLGSEWAEVRTADGRRLGDVPEFISWASDMARDKFGDLAFSSSDAERKHTARKEEIEKIRDTDFDRYEREGLDREYRGILEKELSRKRA